MSDSMFLYAFCLFLAALAGKMSNLLLPKKMKKQFNYFDYEFEITVTFNHEVLAGNTSSKNSFCLITLVELGANRYNKREVTGNRNVTTKVLEMEREAKTWVDLNPKPSISKLQKDLIEMGFK